MRSNPDIFLIVLDTLRFDHLSCNGYRQETTPNIDDFSEDAVRFENAFAAAPWTPPSHASLFTGLYPSNHRYFDTGCDLTGETVAQYLRERNYQTFATVEGSKLGSHTPLSEGFDDIFELFRVVPESLTELPDRRLRKTYLSLLPTWLRYAARALRGRGELAPELALGALRREIRNRSTDRPIFTFSQYLSPHSPYAPPTPYRDEFHTERDDLDEAKIRDLATHGGYRYMGEELSVSDSEWDAVKELYDGEIAYVDEIIGRFLDMLREEGLYDSSLVIITADHGEHFGERGLAYHQFSLYDELIHVPLLIKFPDQRDGGSTNRNLTSLVDLFPTILHETSHEVPEGLDGERIQGTEDRHDFIFAEYGRPVTGLQGLDTHLSDGIQKRHREKYDHALQCVRTLSDKYIKVHDGEDRYVNEHGEVVDIDTDRTASLLQQIKTSLNDDLDVSSTDDVDPTVERNLEKLGYR